jgi:hypothetical protein
LAPKWGTNGQFLGRLDLCGKDGDIISKIWDDEDVIERNGKYIYIYYNL